MKILKEMWKFPLKFLKRCARGMIRLSPFDTFLKKFPPFLCRREAWNHPMNMFEVLQTLFRLCCFRQEKNQIHRTHRNENIEGNVKISLKIPEKKRFPAYDCKLITWKKYALRFSICPLHFYLKTSEVFEFVIWDPNLHKSFPWGNLMAQTTVGLQKWCKIRKKSIFFHFR